MQNLSWYISQNKFAPWMVEEAETNLAIKAMYYFKIRRHFELAEVYISRAAELNPTNLPDKANILYFGRGVKEATQLCESLIEKKKHLVRIYLLMSKMNLVYGYDKRIEYIEKAEQHYFKSNYNNRIILDAIREQKINLFKNI